MAIEKLSIHRPEEDKIDRGRRAMIKGIGALLGLSAAGLLNHVPDKQPIPSGEEKYADKNIGNTDFVIGGPEGSGSKREREGSRGGKGSPEGSCSEGRTCSPERSLWCEDKDGGDCHCTPQASCDTSGDSCEAPCHRDRDNNCVPPHKWECF